jgi:hypothetical protein
VCLGGVEPEALALEGVGGQRDLPPSGQDLGPIQSQAVGEELGSREKEAPKVALLLPQRADHHARKSRHLYGLMQSQHQHWVGAYFHKEAMSVGKEPLRSICEANCLPEVLVPVRGIEIATIHLLSCYCGVEWDE